MVEHAKNPLGDYVILDFGRAAVNGRGLAAEVEDELARARVEREKDLATSTEAAHYAPASLGQSPYVAVPGVGTIVYRKCQWGC